MRIIECEPNQTLVINENIVVTVLEINGDRVRLSIKKPGEGRVAPEAPAQTRKAS